MADRERDTSLLLAAAKAAAAGRSSPGSWAASQSSQWRGHNQTSAYANSGQSGWTGDTRVSGDAGGNSGWRDSAGAQGNAWRADKRVSWSEGWQSNSASTSSWSGNSTWGAQRKDNKADASSAPAANWAAPADAISEAPAATAEPADVADLVTPEAAAPTGAMHDASANADQRGMKRKEVEAPASAATSASLAAPPKLAAGYVAANAPTVVFATRSATLEKAPDRAEAAAATANLLLDVIAIPEETAKASAIHEPAAATCAFTDAATTVVSAANIGTSAATENVPPAAATANASAFHGPAAATCALTDGAATIVFADAAAPSETAAPIQLDVADVISDAPATADVVEPVTTEPAAPTGVMHGAFAPADNTKGLQRNDMEAPAAATSATVAAPIQLVVADVISDAPATADVVEPVTTEPAAPTGAMHGASATADNTQGLQRKDMEAPAAATSATVAAPLQLVAGNVDAVAPTEEFASTSATSEEVFNAVFAVTEANLAPRSQLLNAGTAAATQEIAATHEDTAKASVIHEPAPAQTVLANAVAAAATAANMAAPLQLGNTGTLAAVCAEHDCTVAAHQVAAVATDVSTILASAETRAAIINDAANGTAASSSDNSNQQQLSQTRRTCDLTKHRLGECKVEHSRRPWPKCNTCTKHVASTCHKCIKCFAYFCWECHVNAGHIQSAPQPKVILPPARIPAFPGIAAIAAPASGNCRTLPPGPPGNKRAQSQQHGPAPKRVPVLRDARGYGLTMPPQRAPVMLPQGAPTSGLAPTMQQAATMMPPVQTPPSALPAPHVIMVPRAAAPPSVLPALAHQPQPLAEPALAEPALAEPVSIMSDRDTVTMLQGQGATSEDLQLLRYVEQHSETGRQACNRIARPLVHPCRRFTST